MDGKPPSHSRHKLNSLFANSHVILMGFNSFALCLNEENYKLPLIYNIGPLQLSAQSIHNSDG